MVSTEQIQQLLALIPNKLPDEAKDEILDHYLSFVEGRMIVGDSFEKAVKQLIAEFPDEDMQSIKAGLNKIQRKNMIKTFSPLALSLCALALIIGTSVQSHQPWRLPLPKGDLNRMASGFGYRIHPIHKTPKLHTGIDFTAPLGTPVFPVQKGVVIKVRHQDTGYGNHIEVRHNDSTVSRYAQLHETMVEPGQEVGPKTQIGTVGSSGTSTGPHLHFEIKIHDKRIDPASVDSVFVF